MSFNSRFSCSQSIRLDAMDGMVGARHKTLRHMRAQIAGPILFLLLFKWKKKNSERCGKMLDTLQMPIVVLFTCFLCETFFFFLFSYKCEMD